MNATPSTTAGPGPAGNRWLVCQLGAREHYAIARMLAGVGRLEAMLTDAWAPPGSLWRRLPAAQAGRLHERFHPALQNVQVRAATAGLVGFEARRRLRPAPLWDAIMARNAWFGGWLARKLEAWPNAAEPRRLFAYSYAAKEALQAGRRRGWFCVLGQIDPGPREAELVVEEQQRHPELQPRWVPPPPAYWDRWREECELADCVMVNSAWSREALVSAGVPAAKLAVVPLAYEVSKAGPRAPRHYPAQFTALRPLRVLFLGQVNLRKGVARLLGAARLLRDAPVEFWMVGPVDLGRLPGAEALPNVRWLGPARRGEVDRYYAEADVFLFPTLSDGFGLTQLEAQAHGLPIIATRGCGEVVRPGENGWVVPDPTSEALAAELRACLADPGRLARAAAASGIESQFRMDSIAQQLLALAPTAAFAEARPGS